MSTPFLQWMNLTQFAILQILREVLKEASRQGKTIEQYLADAEKQTGLNRDKADELLAKLTDKE